MWIFNWTRHANSHSNLLALVPYFWSIFPFLVNVSGQYSNLWFFGVFRGHEMGELVNDGSNLYYTRSSQNISPFRNIYFLHLSKKLKNSCLFCIPFRWNSNTGSFSDLIDLQVNNRSGSSCLISLKLLNL